MCLLYISLYQIFLYPLIHKLLDDRDPVCFAYHFLPDADNNSWPQQIFMEKHKELLYF